MERSNIFESLANYDYESMINLYARNGLNAVQSMSRDIHHNTPFAFTSEEKFDESFHLRRFNQSEYKNDSSSSSYFTITVKKLKSIAEKTSKCQSILSDGGMESIHNMKGYDCSSISPPPAIPSSVTTRSRKPSILPYLPNLSCMDVTSTPLYEPITASEEKSSMSMNFRSFRRSNRSTVESKRQKDVSEITHLDQGLIEKMMYERARALSNSRPGSSFTVYSRRSTGKNKSTSTSSSSTPETTGDITESQRNDMDFENQTITIFDGAVAHGTPVGNAHTRGLGGGSGTIQHLACALDSPFGLALVLAMGADVSSRHTAFRRLVVHEAACCDSPCCLELLLELGKDVDKVKNGAKSDNGCMGCQERFSYDGTSYPVKRQKSNNCLLDLVKSENRPIQSNRMPFTSLLSYALELLKQFKMEKITEMDAARLILSKATISDENKAIISLICKVDQQEVQAQSQVFPHYLTYARITNVDGHGNTALHWAAFKNAASCVKLLLKFGANPNAVAESTGWTPLHDAAYSDSADSISILVEAQANVNSKAHSGATPLCFAAQEDSPNAARLLLEAGADATIRCCESGASDTDINHPQFLLQHSRFSGYTPLHYCAHYNSHRAAVVLLEYNAKMTNQSKSLFDIMDLNNKLPIHIVAERGSSDVMKELLHNGVKVNCTRNETSIATSQTDNLNNAYSSSDEEGEEMEQENIIVPSSPNATQTAVVTPISSPILRSLIPTEPVSSSKPWNCLSQHAIDGCKMLLQEAELHWEPKRHYIFTPNDRLAVVELLKVGVRFNHIPCEIWLFIVNFCGRGWFNQDVQSD